MEIEKPEGQAPPMRDPRRRIPFSKQNFIGVNREGAKITDNYTVLKKIGKGGYGIVYELENKLTHDKRACKVLSKKKVGDAFIKEKDILIKVDHPNIVKLYEIYEDPRFYYLVMEECLGGELFDRIIDKIQNKQMYSEKDACKVISQVLKAVAYCHNIGISHRDLKPENLLLAKDDPNSSLKIIDFGLSQDFGKERTNKMTNKVGTAYYVAPEVLKGDYNEKCDVWSAGVILYILLSGDPPFNGRNDQEIYQRIAREKYEFPPSQWNNISVEAKDLIKNMMCKQEVRFTAQQCLDHPWFAKCESSETVPISFNIETFTNYIKSNRIRKMALTFVADRLNEDDILNLKNSFMQYDKDSSGSISLDEFKQMLKQNGCLESDDELEKMFRCADTDQSGTIDYTEFIASALNVKNDIRLVYLSEAFQKFDLDGNGTISKDELMKILRIEEGDVKAECLAKMIDRADKDKNGVIDYQEFLDMVIGEQH